MIFDEKLDKSLDVLIDYFDDDDLWQARFNGVNLLDTLCGIRIFMEDNDMVPVIRCKDCKHYKSVLCPLSMADGYYWPAHNPDFFCADGERREE